MKRTSLILIASAALILLAACGKPTAEEVPAPTPQIVYVTVTPEPTPEPGPTPEEASESDILPLITDTELAEGSFPGGLDDDGPGPEGSEPVEPIELDAGTQYAANIFLSNFAEQFFADYAYDGDDFVGRAVDFAHTWYKVNDRSAIEYREFNGEPYETLTLDELNAVVSRYFPFTIDEWTMENLYIPTEYAFYQDGLLFYMAADGEAYHRIAVVRDMAMREDGVVLMDFAVYEIDIETYFGFDNGIPRSYYELTDAEASRDPTLTLAAEGMASALPHSYNGRAGYQLLDYTTWSY